MHNAGRLNGVPLGATWHENGQNHPNYSNAVRKIIDEIVNNNELENHQKKTMLIDMQFSLRDMLQSGRPPFSVSKKMIVIKVALQEKKGWLPYITTATLQEQ